MRWKVFINSWVVLVALTSKNNSIGTAAENSAGLGLMMDRRPWGVGSGDGIASSSRLP